MPDLNATRQKVHCALPCCAAGTIATLILRIKVHGQRKLIDSPPTLASALLMTRHSRTHRRPRRALFRAHLIAPDESHADQRTYQTRLIVGRLVLLVHLEDGQHEDLGIGLVESRLVPPADHLEELDGQVRAGIQLDVAGEHVEGGRGLTRYVAAYVHWVQQLLLVLVHLHEADVHPWRPERAVVRVGGDLLRRWYLRQDRKGVFKQKTSENFKYERDSFTKLRT